MPAFDLEKSDVVILGDLNANMMPNSKLIGHASVPIQTHIITKF